MMIIDIEGIIRDKDIRKEYDEHYKSNHSVFNEFYLDLCEKEARKVLIKQDKENNSKFMSIWKDSMVQEIYLLLFQAITVNIYQDAVTLWSLKEKCKNVDSANINKYYNKLYGDYYRSNYISGLNVEYKEFKDGKGTVIDVHHQRVPGKISDEMISFQEIFKLVPKYGIKNTNEDNSSEQNKKNSELKEKDIKSRYIPRSISKFFLGTVLSYEECPYSSTNRFGQTLFELSRFRDKLSKYYGAIDIEQTKLEAALLYYIQEYIYKFEFLDCCFGYINEIVETDGRHQKEWFTKNSNVLGFLFYQHIYSYSRIKGDNTMLDFISYDKISLVSMKAFDELSKISHYSSLVLRNQGTEVLKIICQSLPNMDRCIEQICFNRENNEPIKKYLEQITENNNQVKKLLEELDSFDNLFIELRDKIIGISILFLEDNYCLETGREHSSFSKKDNEEYPDIMHEFLKYSQGVIEKECKFTYKTLDSYKTETITEEYNFEFDKSKSTTEWKKNILALEVNLVKLIYNLKTEEFNSDYIAHTKEELFYKNFPFNKFYIDYCIQRCVWSSNISDDRFREANRRKEEKKR